MCRHLTTETVRSMSHPSMALAQTLLTVIWPTVFVFYVVCYLEPRNLKNPSKLWTITASQAQVRWSYFSDL